MVMVLVVVVVLLLEPDELSTLVQFAFSRQLDEGKQFPTTQTYGLLFVNSGQDSGEEMSKWRE